MGGSTAKRSLTPEEALTWLARPKWALLDMGLSAQAGELEHLEEVLGCAVARLPRAEAVHVAHELAKSALPPGRRGRIRLVLRRPAEARALLFVAWVLRSVE